MYAFKKILVCLDGTPLDETLISFVKFIAQSDNVKEINFLNVIKNLKIPEDVLKEFPDLEKKAKSDRFQQIEEKINNYFGEHSKQKVNIEVKEGKIAAQVLKTAKKHNIDLIITGRRENPNSMSGALAQRLARRADCALMIIPEGLQPQIKKILVPIDFSEHSTLAIQKAVQIAQQMKGEVEILCQNVYTVPTGYHYTGKSYEEFAKIMEQNAQKEYERFMKKIDRKGTNIREIYSLDDNEDPVSDIHDMAQEEKVDLIIIGAKGRSNTTAFFIGSMSERLIQLDADFPLLIVRPKGKNAGILDLLKEL